MSINKLRERFYHKLGYRFGAPILNVYRYDELLVVITRRDLFISSDGVYYERVVDGSSPDTQVSR
jgi:hypothetical protein